MNRLAHFYKKVGTTFESVIKPLQITIVSKDVKIMGHMTPGKHQHYYVEQEATLPDDIKYEIRMTNKFAMSQPTTRYVAEVEKEILTYLQTHVKHNTINPLKELDLDLTVIDAKTIGEASTQTIALAESGELKQLQERLDTSTEGVKSTREEAYQILFDVYDASVEHEVGLFEQLKDKIQVGSTPRDDTGILSTSISDTLAFYNLSHTEEVVSALESYLATHNDAQAQALYNDYYHLVEVRARILNYEANMIETYLSANKGTN